MENVNYRSNLQIYFTKPVGIKCLPTDPFVDLLTDPFYRSRSTVIALAMGWLAGAFVFYVLHQHGPLSHELLYVGVAIAIGALWIHASTGMSLRYFFGCCQKRNVDQSSNRRKTAIATWEPSTSGPILAKVSIDATRVQEYIKEKREQTGAKITLTHVIGRILGTKFIFELIVSKRESCCIGTPKGRGHQWTHFIGQIYQKQNCRYLLLGVPRRRQKPCPKNGE